MRPEDLAKAPVLRVRHTVARVQALHIGDRVRTTKESWGDDIVPIGSIGSVAQVRPLTIAFDHDVIGDGTGVWSMMEHQVVFIEPLPARLARRFAIAKGLLPAPRMWACRPGWDRDKDHPDPAIGQTNRPKPGKYHGDAA